MRQAAHWRWSARAAGRIPRPETCRHAAASSWWPWPIRWRPSATRGRRLPHPGDGREPAQLRGRVDAVVIAAPTQLHHELGLEFLGQGIHVLMEKPLAATPAEAEELVAGRPPQRRGAPGGTRGAIQPGLRGRAALPARPEVHRGRAHSPFTFRSTDVGVVLDLMIHDLDLVLNLVGAPLRRVEALGLSVLGGHEDVANARLEFEGAASPR